MPVFPTIDDPEVLIVAGILRDRTFGAATTVVSVDSPDVNLNDLSIGDLTGELRSVLGSGSLWTRLNEAGLSREAAAAIDQRPAMWLAPAAAPTAAEAALLRGAWADVVGAEHREPPVLRLMVQSVAELAPLRSVASVGGERIVASVESRALVFDWGWPARIGVVDGTATTGVADLLRGEWLADEFYGVEFLSFDLADSDADNSAPNTRPPHDIVIVSQDASAEIWTQLGARQIGCLIVVGDDPLAATIEHAEPHRGCAIKVAWPLTGGDLTGLFFQLAHDLPIDGAVSLVNPSATVFMEPAYAHLTAIGRWCVALWKDKANPTLPDPTMSEQFDQERNGARRVLEAARSIEQLGGSARVQRTTELASMASPPRAIAADDVPAETEAAAEAPAETRAEATAKAEPAAPTSSSSRRAAPSPPQPKRHVIAEIHADGKARKKALKSFAEHQLILKIALPRKGDITTPQGFDETQIVLDPGAVTTLDIEVTCRQLPNFVQTAQIVLPNAPSLDPSTSAVVNFRTPQQGQTLLFGVLILQGGRILHEAQLSVPVRDEPVPGDEVRMFHVPISVHPDTRAITTAQVTLIADGTSVRCVQTNREVPVEANESTEKFEHEASRVLGFPNAPTEIKGNDKARELLVTLAGLGAALHLRLLHLGFGDPETIAFHADATSPILPLELVYSAEAPRSDARLCDHVAATDPPAGLCELASAEIVCPYAFWGTTKVIARTFRFQAGAPLNIVEPQPLTLRPVLYAAANRADNGVRQGQQPPSKRLATSLRRILRGAVEEIKTWTSWKTKVRETHPQLLVFLAHSAKKDGELQLEIGKADNFLGIRDIQPAHIRAKDAPPPLVLLIACAGGVADSSFEGFPSTFTQRGAAAVVAALTKLNGAQGASAAATIVEALHASGANSSGTTLGAALRDTRRKMLADGLLLGLLIVSHGEIDLVLSTTEA